MQAHLGVPAAGVWSQGRPRSCSGRVEPLAAAPGSLRGARTVFPLATHLGLCRGSYGDWLRVPLRRRPNARVVVCEATVRTRALAHRRRRSRRPPFVVSHERDVVCW